MSALSNAIAAPLFVALALAIGWAIDHIDKRRGPHR